MDVTTLPPIIRTYFAAADAADVDAVVACFTPDAVVIDEREERRGHDAIRRWRQTAASAFDYTVELRGAEPGGEVDGLERHDVHTHLEGDFPGGTVDLTNRFGLRGGRIAFLEIAPG